MSLIQLRDAEKRVTGLLGELFVQKREVYCNVTRAMNELNTSFMFAMKKNIDFVSEINTARSTITAAGADARKALDKSRLAFGDASKAKDITSTVADQLKQAQDANEKTKQLADEVETLEKMNEATLKKVEAERSKMAELKKELESAVSLERVRVNSIGGNFIQAVEIVKNSGNEVAAELCRKGTFAPPNVMIEDAFDVIERLVVISPFGSFNETNSLLQQYTLGTAALGLSVEELMKRGNEANKRALEALASAEEGERHSYRAKEIATNVVKGEMNAKRKELCTAEATLTENTQELEKLKAQESYLFKNITLMDVLLKKIVVNATTGSANCSGIAAVVKEAAKTALEVGGDAEQAAELTSAYCARVFSNVSAHEKKAKKVTAKIVSMKQNTDQVHSAAQISLDKSRSELNKMKKSFSGLLQYVEGHEIMPVNGECSEPDKFNTIHISFENATAIYSKIRDIGTFNGASVSGNLSVSRNAVSRAAEQLGIATQNARVMEEQTARIYQHVEVVDANARATLKRALGKQRSGLCDTLMRLMEMNRNASALREKMAVSRKSVVTHWHRAMKSQGDAKSVVARDANAAPHISSALTESQRTIDAVKRTRMTSRRMMKNATAVIKANEERMKHINKTFANTTKTVSAQSCNSDADVCHVSDLCNITSNLEISLHEINKLTDLMNITAAAGWLEGLMLESESVEMLLKEADKHASAAESAAQKAMEAGGCVPLDVQLLHMINDKS
ncbi:hypothetical protein, conserved in T. vivax [Trypanosoma vivax Y486]|uniref:Uncharacterized protein n=1 Tax=Trypanosoma vivax (strain Y486) TaxID=1055687 RepID=F9WTB3_TRYVY|nr:hypothetical protein, conserved in T. vivax [Trypanosoma vivax Y486]|eukprot:CCD20806.1 hypothetical protein, conserved in T. vivax [Trypanosoma vivax Y486]